MNFEKILKEYAEKTEKYLCDCYRNNDAELSLITEAEKYSLLSGGKRIRAYLVFELCSMFGGAENGAAPFACAVEMVHAYSLVHDDLPCMDNDDYRRGKLTNHKVYGEAVATLAGDALLTKAFEIASGNTYVTKEAALAAVYSLAVAAGDYGMVGGQILDIKAENGGAYDLEYLKKTHLLKTGAMIKVSARLGCLAAGIDADSDTMRDVESYAENIGLAFQIVDDVLDKIGNSKVLGKKAGSDKDNQKLTFMSFYSVDESMALAHRLTDEAKKLISKYPNADNLFLLAEYLLGRDH